MFILIGVNMKTNKKNANNRIEVKYKSLAPEEVEEEEISGYLDSFRYALNNPDVKNIAVTGKYGAGKSTIIKSVFKKLIPEISKKEKEQYEKTISNKKKIVNRIDYFIKKIVDCFKIKKKEPALDNVKILYLSLASFCRDDDKREDIKKANYNNRKANEKEKIFSPGEYERVPTWILAEKSLLQQMLYSSENKDLPLSRFYKLEPDNKLSNFFFLVNAIIFTFLLIIVSHMFNLYKRFPAELVNGLFVFAFFISLGFVLWRLIRKFFNYFSIASIDLGKAELKVKENRSVFNEYIDEILYFFMEKKYSIVVIEDVDRLQNPSIFDHLRELNNLLNNNGKIKSIYQNNGNLYPIKFIYAVRDNIFSTVEADLNNENADTETNIAKLNTKFFEWIIPVIPYLTSTNAGTYLIKRFEMESSKDASKDFKNFLLSISIYCDDVRVWNNTVNEFKLYQSSPKIIDKISNYSPKKLLTIMLYKNCFPNQYEEFLNQNGNLYGILFKKSYHKGVEKDLKSKNSNDNAEEISKKVEKIKNCTVSELIRKENDEIIDELLKTHKNSRLFLRFALYEGYIDETINDYLIPIGEGQLTNENRKLLMSFRSGEKIEFNQLVNDVDNLILNLNIGDLDRRGMKLDAFIKYGLENNLSEELFAKMQNNDEELKPVSVYKNAVDLVCNESNKEFDEDIGVLIENINEYETIGGKKEQITKLLSYMTRSLDYNWHIQEDSDLAINLICILIRYLGSELDSENNIDCLKEIFEKTPSFSVLQDKIIQLLNCLEQHPEDVVDYLKALKNENPCIVVEFMKLIKEPELYKIVPNPKFGEGGKQQEIINRFKGDEDLLRWLQKNLIIGNFDYVNNQTQWLVHLLKRVGRKKN